jgi:polar amino acid transport system substrate-binding protein
MASGQDLTSTLPGNWPNASASSPSDLSGKRIGILAPSTYELYLKGAPLAGTGIEARDHMIENPEIVAFESDNQAFEALTKERSIDATMNYLPVLMDEIRRSRPLRIIGTPLFFVSNGIAIDKGDPELFKLIHDTIAEMRTDGTLGRISIKWFEFDLSRIP